MRSLVPASIRLLDWRKGRLVKKWSATRKRTIGLTVSLRKRISKAPSPKWCTKTQSMEYRSSMLFLFAA
jgi:hypothetical protein